MNLLPHEEKIARLNSPQLYLTNQRVLRDGNNYGSINLQDITLIKTETNSNIGPMVLGLGILGLSAFLSNGEYLSVGIGIFVLSILYFISQRVSTLDIHAPGSGSLSVRINFIDRKTLREFISKIETEMERVKSEPRTFKAFNEPVVAE